jgi:hypothetical protein
LQFRQTPLQETDALGIGDHAGMPGSGHFDAAARLCANALQVDEVRSFLCSLTY